MAEKGRGRVRNGGISSLSRRLVGGHRLRSGCKGRGSITQVSGLPLVWKSADRGVDDAVIHPDLPYLHIIHPVPPSHSLPYPLTSDSSGMLVDVLAPALMKCLDIAFDALRIGGGNRDGGWNLLMTL